MKWYLIEFDRTGATTGATRLVHNEGNDDDLESFQSLDVAMRVRDRMLKENPDNLYMFYHGLKPPDMSYIAVGGKDSETVPEVDSTGKISDRG